MASYNKVILMGNLTRKPEVRFLQNGNAVCKFGLAVNRRFKEQSGEWKEEVTFIDVTMWGKRGEAFAKYHDKGKSAFIEGRLHLNSWQDKTSGEKRSKLEVIAEEWQFVDGRPEGGRGGMREGGAAEGAPAGNFEAGGGGGGEPEFLDSDDVPF